MPQATIPRLPDSLHFPLMIEVLNKKTGRKVSGAWPLYEKADTDLSGNLEKNGEVDYIWWMSIKSLEIRRLPADLLFA